MKQFFLTSATLLLILSTQQARADVMADVCDLQTSYQNWADTSIGLSCKQVKSMTETYKVVRISIEPLMMIAAAPMVKEAFAHSAEVLLNIRTPQSVAILSVVVMGAYGINTVKILMNEAIEECARRDQEQFKQQILEEVYRKFGVSPQADVPFEVHTH
ncbi:hypothetical protein ACLSU7_14540 [Bdellovibrio sp. HCB185ZH]|uniref:hypothetical protein n=1 Tax=Bdellovibrio sp. HCB185ZH TaxID=3394235 RepID=UPI0039A633EF